MSKDVDYVEIAGAKFNDGLAKLMRIGKLKGGCHDARTNKQYHKWFSWLQGIRSEINAKLSKPEEIKQNDNKERRLSEREEADKFEKIARLYLDGNHEKEIRINNKRIEIGEIDIYDLLFNYELWLGDLEEKYKFGMPDNEDIWLQGENI